MSEMTQKILWSVIGMVQLIGGLGTLWSVWMWKP
jgi:hypothetical protein